MATFAQVIAAIRNSKQKDTVQTAITMAAAHCVGQNSDRPSLDYFNMIIQAAMVAACNTYKLNKYLGARFGLVAGVDKAGQPIYRLRKDEKFADSGLACNWYEFEAKTEKEEKAFDLEKFLQGGAKKGGVEVAVLQAYIKTNSFKNEVDKLKSVTTAVNSLTHASGETPMAVKRKARKARKEAEQVEAAPIH